MKKYMIFLAVVLAAILLLCACEEEVPKGNGNTPQDQQTTDTTPTPTPTPNPTPTPTPTPTPAPHTHTWGEWVSVQDPTCKQQGKRERVCTCGEKEQEDVAIVAHSYQNGTCGMCGGNDPDFFLPDYGAGEANTVGNDYSASYFTAQADWLYFTTTAEQIVKMKRDGTSLTTVYEVSVGVVYDLNVVGDWIYFYCEGDTEAKSYIAKVRTDGKCFEKIVSEISIYDMLVVKDTIFFTRCNWTYRDYAKECMPLYSVSVNGGVTKQLHDGAVTGIMADDTYVYFRHVTEDDVCSIYRMKHDTTGKTPLMSGKDVNYFTMANGRLYFLVLDEYEFTYTVASITTRGGDYTEHFVIDFYSEILHVAGDRVYYDGAVYSEEDCFHYAGLICYDMVSGEHTLIMEGEEYWCYHVIDGLIIAENYENEVLCSLSVYDTASGTLREFALA